MGKLLKHWPLTLSGILLIATVAVSVLFPEWIQSVDFRIQSLLIGSGWALFVVRYLYDNFEKVYVSVNTARLRLTNGTTKWDFTVTLENCAGERQVDRAWSIISHQLAGATRWHADDHSLIVDVPGYTLRVFSTQGTSPEIPELVASTETCIQVSNLELPFRSFRPKIKNEIIPLIQDLSEALEPQRGKYAAKIGFSSANPYFGFFVRRLDLSEVVSFNCDLIESSVGARDQNIKVRKDRIEIVTDSPLALQTLSLKYVALEVD